MPVSHLLRKDFEELTNLPSHGLGPTELKDELRLLLEKDWIRFSYSNKCRTIHPSKDVLLCDLYLVDISTTETIDRIVVWLTSDGGLAWEEFAEPNWSMFIDCEKPAIINGRLHLRVRCLKLSVAEMLRDLFAYWGMLQPSQCQIEILEGWKPVYWKAPVEGFRLLVDTGIEEGTVSDAVLHSDLGIMEVGGHIPQVLRYFGSIWRARYQLKLRQLWKDARRAQDRLTL
jgi:hypothetical protein